MQVQDIMTSDPVCVSPDTSLEAVAQMMVDFDCGAIPVCDGESERVIGIITDRDIVCRTIAKGLDPLEMIASDAMTSNPYTIGPEATVDECIRLMQRNQVRRVPVTDEQGKIIGMVAQADLATRAAVEEPDLTEEFEEALEEISQPRSAI